LAVPDQREGRAGFRGDDADRHLDWRPVCPGPVQGWRVF